MTHTANNHDNTPSYLYYLAAAAFILAAFAILVAQGYFKIGAN